ncbi:pentatricopeptide repeat-containing protein [Tanacetum coccineum]
MQALKVVTDADASLSLFKWAKRQTWYKASDEVYVSLIERLNECRDFDGIQSVFDDLVDETGEVNGFSAFSRIVQCLAKAEKLEVSFCCFKKIQETGCRVDTKTYNSLINLFLEKGLPFKAFEIYENMEGSGCSLDCGTYELMIPSLAKSGRIDAALKLFQQMKEKNIQPGFTIFSSLVDSLGKAGRLDTAMKAYMEMQGFGIKPSATMFVSMIESYVKAGKLEMGLKIWDEIKKARFRPNYGLYTMIVESNAIKPRIKQLTHNLMGMTHLYNWTRLSNLVWSNTPPQAKDGQQPAAWILERGIEELVMAL